MKSMTQLKDLKRKFSGFESGFTLVELLIVIAIIGILAAIAIPQFTQYKYRSYDADAKANLHHAYLSCKAYWVDNGPTPLVLIPSGYDGYIQSADVNISASGDETGFSANAQNTNSTNSFAIDSKGSVSQL